VICILLPATLRAQPTDSAATPWYQTVAINGLVSGSWTANFNHPESRMNAFRVFDVDANSIEVDLVQLSISKTAVPGSVGFRVDLDAGPHIPALSHSAGLDMGDFGLRHGCLTYIDQSGLRFDFGKFVTPAGAEVIESFDGINMNASHSYLFGYAIPFTHTGLKVAYSISDAFGLMAMVTNGWDNVVDNNDAKTVGLQLTVTPVSDLSLIVFGLLGAEQTLNNSNQRKLVDVVISYKLSEAFSLVLNADYGMENIQEEAKWSGIAGYLRYAFSDMFAVNLRGEVFRDADGLRTGTIQTLREVTITPEYRITPNLILRGDFRYDWTGNPAAFEKSTASGSSQATASVNAICLF
jgi:hypothetical protein